VFLGLAPRFRESKGFRITDEKKCRCETKLRSLTRSSLKVFWNCHSSPSRTIHISLQDHIRHPPPSRRTTARFVIWPSLCAVLVPGTRFELKSVCGLQVSSCRDT
jgi:hypothetical protein